jgi:hypothetical protein
MKSIQLIGKFPMPCLEVTDLSDLAQAHITAQRANIQNLRTRRAELEAEERRLPPDSPRHKQVTEAVNHLRLELDGEIESPPGSRNFVKNPDKKTAEERIEVMAALYRERTQFVFKDTTKNEDKPRTASVFGLPTVEEMQRLAYKEVADAIMVRAVSLLQQRQDSRNPVDFLDDTGLNVKVPLANTVEHHHIYNNVHLDENGRVEFKSFKIRQDRTTGQLTMDIVPTYWNSEQHGRNTQFIGLLDGMHSGADPVTHLHYYRFNDEEAKGIRAKISADIKGITDVAKTRQQRLESQLETLKTRAADPSGYERSLVTSIDKATGELAEAKAAARGLLSKPKSSLTSEQLQLRESYDSKQKELKRLNKDLEEHQTLSTLRGDIKATGDRITELQARVSAIKLSEYPKGTERDAKRLEREETEEVIARLRRENRDREKLLKDKGDISQQIQDVERRLSEQIAITSLTEKDALAMFERSNGFLSFDKGHVEKEDHSVYRPIMNREIQKHYVRETIDYLEREYGDNALSALQDISRRQYQQNILERISALQDKIKGRVAVVEED